MRNYNKEVQVLNRCIEIKNLSHDLSVEIAGGSDHPEFYNHRAGTHANRLLDIQRDILDKCDSLSKFIQD
jgi:hypothetical protein